MFAYCSPMIPIWIVAGVITGIALSASLLFRRGGATAEVQDLRSKLDAARISEAAAMAQRDAAQQLSSTQAEELKVLRERGEALRAQLERVQTSLHEKQISFEAQLATWQQSEARLKESFQAMAAEALRGNSGEQRLQLEHVVKPLADSLCRFNDKVQDIETKREGAYAEIRTQIEHLRRTSAEVGSEASRLANALRMPAQKGRWGEVQLRRIVELAGMLRYCDFDEQVSVRDDNDRLQRPDMTVHLPGGRTIVLDSKVSLKAYLEADALEDEAQRKIKLAEHARQLNDHISKLAEKRYWSQFNRAPEFVIAFVPSEAIFSAALQQDPNLIEAGAEKNVVLATPTTLIALLRSVAYGWRQEEVLRNAEEISRLGKQLYDRLRTLCEHFAKLGNSLNSTVKHYNAAVGAFESRVLTGARKFRDLGAAATGELEELPVIETMPRELLSPEMLALPSSTEN